MMNIIQTYQTNKYFVGKVNTCDYIVLHHTGKGKTLDIVKYLANNPKQVSCHYIIGDKWEIYQIASDDKCTRHAGESSRDWKKELNYYSIGIEIVSEGNVFSDLQRASVRELVSSLWKKHNLKPQCIIRHKDIAPGRKRDVGDAFWNNEYKTYEDYQKSYGEKQIIAIAPEATEAMKAWIRNGDRPHDLATREEVAIMVWRGINQA